MQKNTVKKITSLHDDDKHNEIIKLILIIPENKRDYEANSLLARAYNNLGRHKEAVELLNSYKNEGKDDPLWHYRLAYAYMGLDMYEEAIECFAISAELDPDDTEAPMLINHCKKMIEQLKNEKFEPIIYTDKELDTVKKYIESNFGPLARIMFANTREYRIDIGVINPTATRNYYTLITIGAGAYRMKGIPEEFENRERMELILTLPPDWKHNEEAFDLANFLAYIAKFPMENDAWFVAGHAVSCVASSNFESWAPFQGLVLTYPCVSVKSKKEIKIPGNEKISQCPMPDGSIVNFYQVIPLYREEIEFKSAAGVNSIFRKLLPFSHVFDNKRENLCA